MSANESHEDRLIRLLVQRRLLTPDQLNACVRELQASGDVSLTLGQLLVRRRVISVPQLLELNRACGEPSVTGPEMDKEAAAGEKRQAAGIRQSSPAGAALPGADPGVSPGGRFRGSPDPEALNSRHAGRFTVIRELGRGGMAVVLLVHDAELDRQVALKVVSVPSGLQGQRLRQRCGREISSLKVIQHPHSVRLLGHGETDDEIWIAMDYVEGSNLEEVLSEGPLELDRVVDLMILVADAVDACHEEGVIHRDIKPANILIDGRGNPYVSDFGLSKVLESEVQITQTGATVGTPLYLSPEQARGVGAEVDRRSDVFALGVLLFECLVGHPPIRTTSPVDLIRRINDEPAPPPSRLRGGVPADLDAICLRALEKDPSLRYQTARDLCEDLRQIKAAGLPDRRGGRSEHLARPWRHSRSRLLAGLGVAFVGGGLALLAVLGYQEARRETELTEKLTEIAGHLDAGHAEAALRVGEQLRTLAPDDRRGRAAQALAILASGREEAAEELLTAVLVELEASGRLSSSSDSLEPRRGQRQGWAERLLEESTLAGLVLAARGQARLHQGAARGALDDARRGLERQPFDVELRLLSADALLVLDRVEEATEAFLRCTMLSASDARACMGHARALVRQKRLDEAEQAARRAVSLATEAEGRVRAQAVFADVLAAQGQAENAETLRSEALGAAEKMLAAATRRGRDSAVRATRLVVDLLLDQALFQAAAGKWQQAREQLRRASDLGSDQARVELQRVEVVVDGAPPRDAAEAMARARYLIGQGDIALASRVARLAATLDPRSSRAWLLAIEAARRASDPSAVWRRVKEGLNALPESAELLLERSSFWLEPLGDPTSAMTDADEAVRLLREGGGAGVIASWGGQAIDGLPPPPPLYRALVLRAKVLMALDRYDDAAAALDEAATLEPGRPEALHQHAMAAYARRDYYSALHSGTRALEQGCPHTKEFLEMIFIGLGMPASAGEPEREGPPSDLDEASIRRIAAVEVSSDRRLWSWKTPDDLKRPSFVVEDRDHKVAGNGSVRVLTSSGLGWFILKHPKSGSAEWSLEDKSYLRLFVYAKNPNLSSEIPGGGGFQRGPRIVLGDSSGARRTLTPRFTDGRVLNGALDRWVELVVPLRGGDSGDGLGPWLALDEGGFSLQRVDWLEIYADTWEFGFSLWIDGVRFE